MSKRVIRLFSVLSLSLVLTSLVHAESNNAFQTLGGIPVHENQTLVFGGSFSPPTMEHMGLVTRLMTRFGFAKTKMVVATPYKKGAVPAHVSLGLTRVAVEHADEVLSANSIDYKNFAGDFSGAATWIGNGGKRFELSVDDYEIRSGTKENALKTIRHLRTEVGSPKNLFWLAGGDSFASVPTWTPEWRELFENANWIIVSRAGFDTGDRAVRFREKNPLLRALGEEFLKNYSYYFDQTNQVHVYRNLDSAKPDIFVVDQPALADSSTENRKSLAEVGDHEHAQSGLQPSVFKECVKNGYYANPDGGQPSEIGYSVFSRQNLEIYLRWLFLRVEERQGGKLSAEEIEDFHEMSDVLIRLAGETARENAERPKVVAAAMFAYETLADWISELRDIRNISKHIREASKKYGIKTFATVYVALEIAETTIFPALMYYLAGPAGAAIAPFLHPNEVITIPTYIVWRLWKSVSEKKRRAGSVAMYNELTNYRNRLLRGDPEAIVSRVRLKQDLGLDDARLTLNIVKSRLPKWVPLAIRRWDDRRVVWHDLNISTNELAAILGNKELVAELGESAGDDKGLFGNLLLATIMQEPKKRVLFELFVSARYFRALAFGEVSNELLNGFSEEEQRIIREIYSKTESVRNGLPKAERARLAKVLGMTYAVTRVLRGDPKLQTSAEFWGMVFDLTTTEYPGQKASNKDRKTRSLLEQALSTLGLYEIQSNPQSRLTTDEVIRDSLVSNALDAYLHANLWLFLVDEKDPSNEFSRFELLQSSSRGDDHSKGNLLWEMRQFKEHATREFQNLDRGFETAVEYLKARPIDQRVERMFWQALDRIDDELTKLHKELRDLEYEWLRLKYPHQYGRLASQESEIQGYADVVAKYKKLQSQFDSRLDILRSVNQMMSGAIVIDVTRADEVKNALSNLLNLERRAHKRLGLNVCERLFVW